MKKWVFRIRLFLGLVLVLGVAYLINVKSEYSVAPPTDYGSLVQPPERPLEEGVDTQRLEQASSPKKEAALPDQTSALEKSESAVGPPAPVKYLKLTVAVQASAEFEALSYRGKIEFLGYSTECEPSLQIKAPWVMRPKADTQPAEGRTDSRIPAQTLCLVLPQDAPEQELTTYPMLAADTDIANGEEYFGADPDSLQAGFASAYVPRTSDSGYLIGIFALAGYVCDPLDCSLGAWGVSGVAVKIEEGSAADLPDHRYLIETLTPMDNQANVMIIGRSLNPEA
jgi:hypothetical protein